MLGWLFEVEKVSRGTKTNNRITQQKVTKNTPQYGFWSP
jgi:hypothetical protein